MGASTLLFNQKIPGTKRASDIKTNASNGLAALTFRVRTFLLQRGASKLSLSVNQKLPI
jgi:hypothetical protein